jgi:hypothetical protein
VWLSDCLLDENEGGCSEALLIVEIDAGLVEPYEWVSDPSMGYREFLVPAAIINAHATVTGADWTSEYEKLPEIESPETPASGRGGGLHSLSRSIRRSPWNLPAS